MVLVAGVFRVEAIHPRLQRGQHIFGVAPAQFNLRAVPYAVFRLLEQFKQPIDRLPRDLCRLEQRPSGIRHPVHASVRVVARRVAQVVLHVTDERVVPIKKVQRPVRSDLGVDRIFGQGRTL